MPLNPTATSPPTLRVLSLNLFGRQADWPARQALLRDGLARLQPDLIAFQEAIVDDDGDQVTGLLDAGFHVAYQSVGLLGDGNHGAAIASRWPIRERWEIDLHPPGQRLDYPCGALIADIAAPPPFAPLHFAAYGPWYPCPAEAERERQASAVASAIERIAATRSVHVLLAGDFNATPETASMRFWTGQQSLAGLSVCYQDGWGWHHRDLPAAAGHTFAPRNPLTRIDEPRLEAGRRIDYVLQRCGPHGPTLQLRGCEVVFTAPMGNTWASDHFGILAEYAPWPAAPAGT